MCLSLNDFRTIVHHPAFFPCVNPTSGYCVSMTTMHMTEEHMGTDATRAEAEHMVELLRDRGYDIAYGTGPGSMNDIPDDVWQECLQRVAAATAARAMRAIPSEARAEASRQNGKKGGRPRLFLYEFDGGSGFRRVTIDEPVRDLDPDGFVAGERLGDAIVERVLEAGGLIAAEQWDAYGPDGAQRLLYWETEEESEDDDGSRAAGQIIKRPTR